MKISEFSSLKNKKILVTGGAGFIGSHICFKLVEIGSNVICLDNLSNGKTANIESLIARENFKFIEEDTRNFNQILKICTDVNIVNHQAALGSVPRSISDPINTHGTNVNGTLNILEASRLKGVELVVFASSSSVYGNLPNSPKIEREIGAPLSPYAVTKLINELYAAIYKKTYDLNYIGLRYFNVFGDRQDSNSPYSAVIPKFIDQLKNNKTIIINGDGSHSRDFTHVDNVVYANLKAMISNHTYQNQIYNVGCGQEHTLNELVQLIIHNFNESLPGLKFEVRNEDERKGDVKSSKASIDKIVQNLGYSVQKDFTSGIKELILQKVK